MELPCCYGSSEVRQLLNRCFVGCVFRPTITILQNFRAGVRLAAFWESGYKMLLQGGEVANEEEVTVLEDNHGVNGNGVPVIYLMNGHSQNG